MKTASVAMKVILCLQPASFGQRMPEGNGSKETVAE